MTERRKRGRPPVLERKIPLSTRLAPRDFDRLTKTAVRRDQSLSSLLRQIVERLPERDFPS